jgi:uncharacterized protein involved in oxidation of intracellular sulfur
VKVLFVFHDSPYGTERTYNGLRWARELLQHDGTEVKAYLFGDAVVSVTAGHKVAQGYYNIANMVESLARHGGEIGGCGTCLDARGIAEDSMVKGSRRASVRELGEWTAWADKVINV